MRFVRKILAFLRHTFYLFFLYFRRGIGLSLFYLFTLLLILSLVGFLLETNAKMDRAVEEINQILPANRVKITFPANVQVKRTGGGILSLFGKTDEKITRTKNFISPRQIQEVSSVPGIKKVTPLYSIDFPMGVEFGIPGGGQFRAEVIGIGIPEKEGASYIRTSQKSFRPTSKRIPVLVASYLLEVFNTILQNNDISFKITEKNVLGLRFQVTAGSSVFTSGSQRFTPQTYTCEVVGFIDLDYTYGIAFPASFVEPFKKRFWKNFQRNHYDSLMVEIDLTVFDRTLQILQEKGFWVHQDTGIFQKISRFIRENKRGIGIFLQFISIVILILGMIIAFYTILWMLKGRSLEFSLYRFFGSSNLQILLLYGSYLSVLNLLALFLTQKLLEQVFFRMGSYLLNLKKELPVIFQNILQADFLLQPLFLSRFFSWEFGFLEVAVFFLIGTYLVGLNKKL